MPEAAVDFDALLDLENQFYSASYNDALREGEAHTARDGKQFGIQTGFQRFVLIGALKRANELLLEVARHTLATEEDTPNRAKYEKHQKSLSAIQKSIEQFYATPAGPSNLIQASNTPEDVELFEKNIKLIRSKIKAVYAQMGHKSLYPDLENSCKITAGDIPATQVNGDEKDMW